MLKITNLAYQHASPCRHLKITVDDDGDVHEVNTSMHEDELIDLLKDFAQQWGLEGSQSDMLLIIWGAVMIHKRGHLKSEILNVDIDIS